jgi:hypothetical protein
MRYLLVAVVTASLLACTGAPGPQGEPGQQGLQGPPGVGVMGSKGDKGDPGSAGVAEYRAKTTITGAHNLSTVINSDTPAFHGGASAMSVGPGDSVWVTVSGIYVGDTSVPYVAACHRPADGGAPEVGPAVLGGFASGRAQLTATHVFDFAAADTRQFGICLSTCGPCVSGAATFGEFQVTALKFRGDGGS